MSDAAITNVVTGVVTVTTLIVGFLTLWIKLRYGVEKAEEAAHKASVAVVRAHEVEDKIDHNTKITEAGNKAAVQSAMTAASAAADAKVASESIDKKLNGGVDSAIAPLQKALDEHVRKDEESLLEVNDRLKNLAQSLDTVLVFIKELKGIKR